MSRPSITLLRALPQRQLSAVVLILFLAMQSFALLHAETHAFHEKSEMCTVFQSVEHQPMLGGLAVAAISPVFLALEFLQAQSLRFDTQKTIGFLPRGPPQIISKA